jgi:hypothetical protein
MATQEFYIRNATDTEARGPFALEQLSSLAESGQVTPATLYYETATEAWAAIETNAALKAALFPEKKKLTLKPDARPAGLNPEHDPRAPITVGDLLAAAEGRTADTQDKKDPTEAMARAAALGRWAAIAALVLAAAGEVLPSADAVMALDFARLAAAPLVFLGAVDLLLAVLLGLGVVSVYPFVRFRAALGLGFLGFVFWCHGQTGALLALAAGSAGLFFSTVFVSYVSVALAALLGIAGFGLVAWRLLS